MQNVLEWRARGLVSRILPFIEPKEQVLDIGWGTGHNGQRLRQMRRVEVSGLDVVDMGVTGPKPRLYDGSNIPFADESFDVSVLIYMLHYVDDPARFLREVKRVTKKRIIIVQTICQGTVGQSMHRINEFVFGKGAFHVARVCGLVGSVPCPMRRKHDFGTGDLLDYACLAGLKPEFTRLESYAGFLPLGRFTCAFSTRAVGP
jgi:SAM-dependent methyltransferase